MALATYNEALLEFAFNAGSERADQAWLLNENDVWVRNPYYRGPAVSHPEADDEFNAVYRAPTAPSAGWVDSSEYLPF